MAIFRRAAYVVCLLLLASTPAFAQAAWEAHGKLEVSVSGRTIQHRDGTPFLWLADTGWGMFQQLTREQVEQYLDNRRIVVRGAGEREAMKTAVTTAAGDRIVVYFANNSHAVVKNTMTQAGKATWVDPRNGNETAGETFAAGEARSVIPPEGWEDALLVIRGA